MMHHVKGTGQSASQALVTPMRLQWLPALLPSGWEGPGRNFHDITAYENMYQWTADETRCSSGEWFCEETGAAVAVRFEPQTDWCDFILPHE